jgi:phytoene dehydrogenase-like protein
MERVVVVGAGVGGLTTAALLARSGLDVTVLEAHVYPGGCAGTFYHRGYHFDVGATLAGGFYPGGPMDRVEKAAGIDNWDARSGAPAMVVHLPDGTKVTRWPDERRYAEHKKVFGEAAEGFFRWQERTATALWALALRTPTWPPQSPAQMVSLMQDGIAWLGEDWRERFQLGILADAFRPVAVHLQNVPHVLRTFVDGQLLISAQATSVTTNALYGASALDLPRRGVVHLLEGRNGERCLSSGACGAGKRRASSIPSSGTASGDGTRRTCSC